MGYALQSSKSQISSSPNLHLNFSSDGTPIFTKKNEYEADSQWICHRDAAWLPVVEPHLTKEH
jgi:hypothetical protein